MKKILIALLLVFPSIGYALTVGDRAPAFNAATLDGKQLNYFTGKKGEKAVYIEFWATW